MPAKRSKKKTKKELHESIGELLHRAQVRLEMLEHEGRAAAKEQARKAKSEVSRAHTAFKSSIGRR